MKLNRSLLTRVVFFLVVTTWIVLDTRYFKGPLYHFLGIERLSQKRTPVDALDYPVAQVNGRSITQRMLNRAVENHLWRRGKTPDQLTPKALFETEVIVLDDLVCLMAAEMALTGPATVPEPSTEEIDAELKAISAVFANPKDFEKAVAAQGRPIEEFRKDVALQLRLQRWVETEIQPALTPTEQEIIDWFAENGDFLTIPERFHLRHLFLTSHDPEKPSREEEIAQLHSRLIQKEATFEALVAENTEDPRTKTNQGDLGWISAADAPAELLPTLRTLAPGSFSQPVKSELGWHIIHLIARQPFRPVTLEEATPEIRLFLENQKRREALAELRRQLKSLTKVKYIPRFDFSKASAPPEA